MKKVYYYIACICLCFAIQSCEDFLTEYPEDKITIDTFFFGISFLVAIVIQPLIVLRLNSLASILFSGLFVLIFVWLFVHIVHRLFRIIKGRSSPSPSAMFSFVLLLFLFIWSGVNVLVQTPTSALSINYLRKLIS